MNSKKNTDLTIETLSLLKEHYRLGKILSATELLGGYVNRTFFVSAEDCDKGNGYIARRYNPITANDKDIQFEHSVIKHLVANGLNEVPNVIENKYGTTYIKTTEVLDNQEETRFWAVFECLPGEVRYVFYDTDLPLLELCSSAQTLARLHHAGADFYSKFKINRSQPDILSYLPTLPEQYNEVVQNRSTHRFDTYLFQYREDVFKKIEHLSHPDAEFTEMLKVAIHGDYHQGNLTFRGSDVVGVFDFDWTRVDYRLFDVAQSIIYFCACWDGSNAGSIDLDKFYEFLKAYNDTYINEDIKGQLTDEEIKYFSIMLEVANQFVLFCIVTFYYYSEDADEDDYLRALVHYINIMIWLDENKSKISELVQSACQQNGIA